MGHGGLRALAQFVLRALPIPDSHAQAQLTWILLISVQQEEWTSVVWLFIDWASKVKKTVTLVVHCPS
jgi:hypothetical protein